MKLTKKEQNKLNKQLFQTVENNDFEGVKAAVAAGADVNARDEQDITPLVPSTWDNVDIKIMQFLLEHGANPNLQNEIGGTVLHYYFPINRTPRVKLLLDYNADMYIKNKEGHTPFTETILWNHYDTAELYVLCGYIPTEKDFKDITDTSKKENTPEYYQKLSRLSDEEKQARIEQIVLNGQLFCAVQNNDLEGVKAAVAAGADVNVKDKYGNTALHKISFSINIAEAKLLLGHKADMYIKNKDGFTPFAEALKWGSYTSCIAELYILNGYIPTEEDFEVIEDNNERAEIKVRFFELARKVKMNAVQKEEECEVCCDDMTEF